MMAMLVADMKFLLQLFPLWMTAVAVMHPGSMLHLPPVDLPVRAGLFLDFLFVMTSLPGGMSFLPGLPGSLDVTAATVSHERLSTSTPASCFPALGLDCTFHGEDGEYGKSEDRGQTARLFADMTHGFSLLESRSCWSPDGSQLHKRDSPGPVTGGGPGTAEIRIFARNGG
jgi:hypothetical protein